MRRATNDEAGISLVGRMAGHPAVMNGWGHARYYGAGVMAIVPLFNERTPYTYTGEWRNNKWHGAGTLVYEDKKAFGFTATGHFEHGQPVGTFCVTTNFYHFVGSVSAPHCVPKEGTMVITGKPSYPGIPDFVIDVLLKDRARPGDVFEGAFRPLHAACAATRHRDGYSVDFVVDDGKIDHPSDRNQYSMRDKDGEVVYIGPMDDCLRPHGEGSWKGDRCRFEHGKGTVFVEQGAPSADDA